MTPTLRTGRKSGIDEPREAAPVRQPDGPHASGRVGYPGGGTLDEHFAARETRVVVAELPLVRTIADIGLAIGFAARIESVFGRDGVAVAENDRTALRLGGDGAVALGIVEDLETESQRIEDHLDTHGGDEQQGRTAGCHRVPPRAGMAADIGEGDIDQSEDRDDHPLRLHVAAQRRKEEKADEGRGQQFQRPADGDCGRVFRHACT